VPIVFAVVGHHERDPDRLLLLGDDGNQYQLDPARDVPVPAAADDAWVVDSDPPRPDDVLD
jgi:hypothetical protein